MSDSTDPQTSPAAPKPNGNGNGHGVPHPSRLRRWARDTFTREQMVSALKQLAWVAPLTILIWAYAEREQQVEGHLRLTVEAQSSNPAVAVRLIEPADGVIAVDVRGPRNAVDSLRADQGLRAGGLRFEVPANLPEGTHPFSVPGIVARDDRFNTMSVTDSTPSRITVLIDPIEEVSLEVKVREEDQAMFESPAFNPPKVKVRMPRTTMAAARERSGGTLVAYADLSALPDKKPGEKKDVSGVRVVVPNADPDEVGVEPSTVTASFVLREQQETYTIQELVIRRDVANELGELTSVKLNRVNLPGIRVVGPPDAIEKVKAVEGRNVKAFVTIEAEDPRDTTLRKQIQFWTPDGVKIHPQDVNQTVEVTVRDRPPGPS